MTIVVSGLGRSGEFRLHKNGVVDKRGSPEMSSSDEDVPSVNKRRRLLGSYREEQDSSASPAYDRHEHSSGGAPGRYSETNDLKAAAAAGHSHHGMSNAEPLPARHTEGAAEQQDLPPGEAASLLQRVQRESESLQGTIGRGLPSLLGGKEILVNAC